MLSFAFFRLCQHLVTYYIFGELSLGDFSLFGCKRELANADYEEEELPARTRWRITNEVVSGLHAAICGFWASYALLLNRELVYDMEFTNNVCIYLVSPSFLIVFTFLRKQLGNFAKLFSKKSQFLADYE